ncbi:dual 3',5'-cyclic-AMP and -GMP phosphodiesterase 11, partial [Caerostris darwini]
MQSTFANEKVESWLDEHPQFAHDYFVRKASLQMVDSWLLFHSAPQGMVQETAWLDNTSPGAATLISKTTAHELDSKTSFSRPILNTSSDSTPTFSPLSLSDEDIPLCNCTSDYAVWKILQQLRSLSYERELIFELVKDIYNGSRSVQLLPQSLEARQHFDQRGQMLPLPSQGCLVSQLFDVSCHSTVEQMKRNGEIRIPWGTGIVGYVAEYRESLNIPDCYKDDRFNSQVDRKTGYMTHNMLCMPILDSDGEVKGVAQIINKCHGKQPFTDADEE